MRHKTPLRQFVFAVVFLVVAVFSSAFTCSTTPPPRKPRGEACHLASGHMCRPPITPR